MLNRLIRRYKLDPWTFIITTTALCLSGLVFFSLETLQEHLRRIQHDQLKTVNDCCVRAANVWSVEAKARAIEIARDPELVELARKLKPSAMGSPKPNSAGSSQTIPLLTVSNLRYYQDDLLKVAIADRNGRVLAFVDGPQSGDGAAKSTPPAKLAENRELVQFAWNDSIPFAVFFKGMPVIETVPPMEVDPEVDTPTRRDTSPLLQVIAPIKLGSNDGVSLALVLLVDPDKQLFRAFDVARVGDTGHTYAIDRQNRVLSLDRFHDGNKPVLVDPLLQTNGVNIDGYRDFHGKWVLGSVQWVSDGTFGIVTEIEVEEAYHSLLAYRRYLQWGIYLSLSLLTVSIGLACVRHRRLKRLARFKSSVRLGQYDIGQVIGKGGMGTVYLAQHQFLRRLTAVKLIHDRNDPIALARFVREVRLASRLRHPNTVSIYDYGHPSDDVFFYAMEFINGITLQSLVDEHGPLSEGRVILILKQLCNALREAHGIGLIHRDIKPTNIMLTQCSGMSDFLKLLDFGLVKSAAENEVKLTRPNVIAGTPEYISPETIQDPSAVDARSDIYSVGAVGHYLLTGQPLFRGDSAIDVCMKRLTSAPLTPSTILRRAVDPELERTLMKCLSLHPADRPQSALELKSRLERCRTAGDWSFERAEEWWNRYRESTTEPELVFPEMGDGSDPFLATLILPQANVESDESPSSLELVG